MAYAADTNSPKDTTAPAVDAGLAVTPLNALHRELGAKMVPFAGYDMPVQYPEGVLAEHLHTRQAAGLFDVSHMGQAWLIGPDHETTARALEALVPGDYVALAEGRMRYTLLMNDDGGIRDDLMVTRPSEPDLAGRLFLVVNAACKTQDFAHIAAHLPDTVRLEVLEERALIALQGPKAGEVMAREAPASADLSFMHGAEAAIAGQPIYLTRSGYTGEDGFEISIAADKAVWLAEKLLAHADVKPIGLGARDSLRLEAGLCLYGHDIDETTTPVEAGLTWAVNKRRRAEGGFPGADKVIAELENGPKRKRVGLLPEGKAPAREGAEIQNAAGETIGIVTSGGFGPSVGGPIAMGYVAADHADIGTSVSLVVRGKPRAAQVTAMPFIEKRFKR